MDEVIIAPSIKIEGKVFQQRPEADHARHLCREALVGQIEAPARGYPVGHPAAASSGEGDLLPLDGVLPG
jgi:hypothetical protein